MENNWGSNKIKKPIGQKVAILLLVLLVAFLAIIFVVKKQDTSKASDKLNELAKTFYKYYYEENKSDNEETTKKEFSEWREIGITIKLKDLKIYLDNHKNEDYSAFEKCDDDKTKITVYPRSPYGPNNYKVEYELSCK